MVQARLEAVRVRGAEWKLEQRKDAKVVKSEQRKAQAWARVSELGCVRSVRLLAICFFCFVPVFLSWLELAALSMLPVAAGLPKLVGQLPLKYKALVEREGRCKRGASQSEAECSML